MIKYTNENYPELDIQNDLNKDIVIKDKEVIIDVAVNDRGYGALDYSGNNDGIYPLDAVPSPAADVAPVAMSPEVNQAIEADVDSEDF